MQATDFGGRHDRAYLGALDGSHVGRVFLEREVSSGAVIVGEVAGQDAAQVPLAEHKDMVQAFPPHGANEPFHEGILPRTLGGREDFANPHALDAAAERIAVDLVAIAEEIGRRGVVWEDVDDLLGGPGRGGVLGDVEVEDAPAMVSEHDEDEQYAQLRSGHGEEIDRDHLADMVGEERAPGL